MKNLVTGLYCQKSLLLAITLLFVAGQVHATGKAGGQLPRLAVSSVTEAMNMTPPVEKSTHLPLFGLGAGSLIGGTVTMLIGNMEQSLWFTGLGAFLTACGIVFCVGKAMDIKSLIRVKEMRGNVFIYESDGDYQLGLSDAEDSKYASSSDFSLKFSTGGAKHIRRAKYSTSRLISVVSPDGTKHDIDVEQIRHVFDLNDNYFKMLDEQATIGSEQYPLDFLRDTSHEFLDNAVIAFEHEGTNYLETFSGRLQTDNGGVELIIESSNSREIVISVDSEGKPVLNGEPLQAVIFLP